MYELGAADYITEVGRGNVQGAREFHGLGEADLGAASALYDVWQGPTSVQPVPPATGLQFSIVSTSVNDSAGGTGVMVLGVNYLDANGSERMEIVPLNGTTPVLTQATDIRFIQSVHAYEAGALEMAAGDIAVRSGATIYQGLRAGGNTSLSSLRMVPAGKSLFVKRFSAGSSGNSRTTARLRATANNGILHPVFLVHGTIRLYDGFGTEPFDVPLVFPALSIVKVSVITDRAASVSGSWNGWLEDA